VITAPAQRKKKEEETQTLQVPKDPPSATVGDTRRVTFYVTPPSAKGLLSQQTRDALKALLHLAGSDSVLQIRAFVAGSGDVRRVRDLVSEAFSDRRQQLPALSVIQAGALPMEGAQVVLEGIGEGKKEINPLGLAFLSAQIATAESADGATPDTVPALTAKSLASLRVAVKAAGSESPDVVRVTCFLSSLENLAASRKLIEGEYPKATLNFIQPQRAAFQPQAACEAVAKVRWNTGTRLHFINADELPKDPDQSQIALIASPHIVLTGTQISFGFEEKDSRLALGRLGKALEQVGVSEKDVAFAHYYPLSQGIANQVKKLRGEFENSRPPAATMILFEGLPSMDAGFAVDVIAAKN
jgi:enamine deaminase RidA (YjgF/YER057c/UK114 family)